jgi:hypothetical protein
MRVLLDECIDRRFAREIIGYEVKTVPQMGWAGVKNGNLLSPIHLMDKIDSCLLISL